MIILSIILLILGAVLTVPILETIGIILIVAGVVIWALMRTDPLQPERTALVVVGVALLVSTPTLPWYTLLLLALVALNGRPEWLGVVIAPTVEYLVVGVYGVSLDRATTLSYTQGDGAKAVTYTQTNVQQLVVLIKQLQAQLGLISRARRPLRFRF